eukprot:GEMP01068149.1.p1 GENE.GEMP01068149.1~~GEMP01068149.1.p1  ORF type:complete len:160 (-),score=18.54 GEMP01068149.1:509-988(-)
MIPGVTYKMIDRDEPTKPSDFIQNNYVEKSQCDQPVPILLQVMAGSTVSRRLWSDMCDDEDSDDDISYFVRAKSVSTQSSNCANQTMCNANHDAGNCRPCEFVHKAKGCVKGEKCTFCHVHVWDKPTSTKLKERRNRNGDRRTKRRSNVRVNKIAQCEV